MNGKGEGKMVKSPFLLYFREDKSGQKHGCFYAFISGNSVFLRQYIINEKNKG